MGKWQTLFTLYFHPVNTNVTLIHQSEQRDQRSPSSTNQSVCSLKWPIDGAHVTQFCPHAPWGTQRSWSCFLSLSALVLLLFEPPVCPASVSSRTELCVFRRTRQDRSASELWRPATTVVPRESSWVSQAADTIIAQAPVCVPVCVHVCVCACMRATFSLQSQAHGCKNKWWLFILWPTNTCLFLEVSLYP